MTIWNENYDKGIENALLSIRENILNWYPFKKDETALEVGVASAAITDMLCRKLAKVVFVDVSDDNYMEIKLEEQFDYVILNGVFAYAIGMVAGEMPYHAFLSQISRFLKPNGKVLLTIDNKLGLKYFNGAKESHTGNYFLSLNNYRGNETVRTFSKTELEEILKDAGFEYQKFYYPYPDYKFPNEIFTDESIYANQYGRPATNIETDRYRLFDEYVVSNTLMKENIREIFANSFLVEASRVAFESEVIYAKLNADRKEAFQIGTSILWDKHEKKVIKYAIHPDAQEHIAKICDTTKLDGKKVKYLPAQMQENGIVFEFLNTPNLDAMIKESIIKRDIDAIHSTIEDFFQTYLEEFSETQMMQNYHDDLYCTYFGNEKTDKAFLCIKNANIDIIMDNVYPIDDAYVLIDGEWIYPEWIPYEFLKWRAINELYGKHEELQNLIARAKMLERNGVSVELEELFRSWTLHFAEKYVGSSNRSRMEKPVEHISLDAINQERHLKQMTTMGLYVDTGSGFSEEEKLTQTITITDGRFYAEFHSNLLAKAKKLRLDPVEGFGCIVKLEDVSDDLRVVASNALELEEIGTEGELVFVDLDPQIYIDVNVPSETISLAGTIQILSKDELITRLQEVSQSLIREKNSRITNRVKRKISNIFKK